MSLLERELNKFITGQSSFNYRYDITNDLSQALRFKKCLKGLIFSNRDGDYFC